MPKRPAAFVLLPALVLAACGQAPGPGAAGTAPAVRAQAVPADCADPFEPDALTGAPVFEPGRDLRRCFGVADPNDFTQIERDFLAFTAPGGQRERFQFADPGAKLSYYYENTPDDDLAHLGFRLYSADQLDASGQPTLVASYRGIAATTEPLPAGRYVVEPFLFISFFLQPTEPAGGAGYEYTVRRVPNAPAATAPVSLRTLTLSPSVVRGGRNVTGTVTLSGPAPAGGAAVNLRFTLDGGINAVGDPSPGQIITLPAGVTVPAGSVGATFTITTRAIRGDYDLYTVIAEYKQVDKRVSRADAKLRVQRR